MRSRLLFGIGAAVLAISCSQTDAGITTSVKSQLIADDLVKARRIDVDTREGVVTLTGEVRSAQEEMKALDIARATRGVTNVVDQISVVPEREGAPTTGVGAPYETGEAYSGRDAGITAAVKTKMLADPDVAGLRINVDTRDGMVTLTGTVKTEAEKSEALALAREVEGVTGVNDRITVEAR